MRGRAAVVLAVWAGCAAAVAQGPVSGAGAEPAGGAAAWQGRAFEVVSIRRNIEEGRRTSPENLAPTPDGFHLVRAPFLIVLLTAYTPKGSNGALFMRNIENLPEWAQSENYDIDARTSDSDRAAWQDPKNQPAMLEAMLQTMLADRFRLAVHRAMKDVPVYEVVLAKGGPKFEETKPDEPHPAGTRLPGGAVLAQTQDGAHLYNVSMALLASLLGEKSDRPVEDKTGLTGRYDVDIPRPERMDTHPEDTNGGQPSDPEPAMFGVAKELGLKIESGKQTVEMLVIDHVERPTEN